MKKEQILEHVEQELEENESLIGFFMAQYKPSYWFLLLIGPLWALGIRVQYIAVTERGLYFHKCNILGKITGFDFFSYDEIKSVDFGKGLLQRPMKFLFKNNRKLKLNAQLKGVEKIPKLTPDIQDYMQKKFL